MIRINFFYMKVLYIIGVKINLNIIIVPFFLVAQLIKDSLLCLLVKKNISIKYEVEHALKRQY